MVQISHTLSIHRQIIWWIPQEHKTIIVSSFSISVQRNQFSRTNKQKILYGTVKSTILDVSVSFWMYLQRNLNLDSPGQTSLILDRELRGYKSLEPPTKHKIAITEKLVLHIYKQKIIHIAFFFGMLSCD